MVGVVKWFDNKRGYGFIDFKNNDVLIHYSQILNGDFKTLSSGEKVIIGNIIKTNKGYQAQAVKKLMIQI